MNRREFMNGAVAGLAAVHVPVRFPVPQTAATPTTAEETVRPANWLVNGLIDAGGSHEPYTFVVRRGGQPLNARKLYEAQQSEPVIRRLKEQGIEVFHTHLYKGFGMAAEKDEMQDTVRTAEIVHRYGMKIDTYIQWNTMMYETFFVEEPRAVDWIQRDAAGKPILLVYGYQQSYRYRPCFSNREYLEYLKKIVRYAVVDVKTDFIHFDNFDLNPEPDSCHCPACVQGFRDRLNTKFSPQQRKDRFGFENVSFVTPPQWNQENPPQEMQIIFDPVIQEWIDFRCQLMADALKQMALYAKSLNPEVVIEINPHGITGGNRAWVAAIDHSRLLKSTKVFWTEESNPSGVSADGRLISKIRSFKLARAYNNILFTYPNDEVAIAESLAFGQTIGFAGSDPLPEHVLKYVAFYRKNRELYVGTSDVAPVAVLRSYASITYHQMRSQLSAILVEQALIQSRVPFALIFDEHLADLSKYKVLVLPDTECLSDAQLSSIQNFVEQGGGLLATGTTGLYDQWRHLRVIPGLSALIVGQSAGEAYVEQVDNRRPTNPAKAARKEYGKGRVVYLPEVQFDGALPQPEPYFEITNKYWKLPANHEEITQSIDWLNGTDLPLRIKGPNFLVANLVSQSANNRLVLHLVNYAARSTPALHSIEVECSLPNGMNAREIVMNSPDATAPQRLATQSKAGSVKFVVSEIKAYSVISIST